MDPSGPSQPSWPHAYETEGNPATSNPAEQQHAAHKQHSHAHHKSTLEEDRTPGEKQHASSQSALPTSLAQGVRGAPAGEERYGRSEEQVGRHRELDGEQMRAPGEGRVADVVEEKPGAGPYEPDFASDLDRKKKEQASLREEMKSQREHGMVSDEAGIGRGTEGLRDA